MPKSKTFLKALDIVVIFSFLWMNCARAGELRAPRCLKNADTLAARSRVPDVLKSMRAVYTAKAHRNRPCLGREINGRKETAAISNLNIKEVSAEGYYLAGMRDPKIREYITGLMAFCFGQFGITREEVERMVEIIAGCRSFEEARQALSAAGFKWGETGNKYYDIYRRYKKDLAPVVKYNTLKDYVRRGGFGRNAVVMDIGCGNHAIAKQMIDEMRKEGIEENLIPTVIGVDFAEDPKIEDPHGKIKYIKQDVNNPGKIPIDGEAVADRIFILSALHHMPADVIQSVLGEARRLLKADGDLVIFEDAVLEGQAPVYDEEGLAVEKISGLSDEERRIAFTIFDWHANCVVSDNAYVPMPGSYFTEAKWHDVFADAGFHVDYSRYVGVYRQKFSNLPHAVFILKKKNIELRVVRSFTGEKRIEGLDELPGLTRRGIEAIVESEKSRGLIKEGLERSLNRSDVKLTGKYWIVIDKQRKEELERAVGKDIIEEQINALEGIRVEGKQVFHVVDGITKIPAEAFSDKTPRVLNLFDIEDRQKIAPRRDMLYLPALYTGSSLYIAAHLLVSGGDINSINDKLIVYIINNLCSALLGKEVLDRDDLYKLFRTPWNIKRISENLNVLREFEVEIEKAA